MRVLYTAEVVQELRAIFMPIEDDAVVVLLALAHGKRKAGYWKKRLRLVAEK